MKKTALEKIGLLDESIRRFQEWETGIRPARHFRFAFVVEPTVVYDCRGTDTMTKAFATAGGPCERILCKHFRDMLRYAGVPAVASHFFVAGRCYWLGWQWLQACRCWVLFGFCALLDPMWLCGVLGRALRSGAGRGSLRFER